MQRRTTITTTGTCTLSQAKALRTLRAVGPALAIDLHATYGVHPVTLHALVKLGLAARHANGDYAAR